MIPKKQRKKPLSCPKADENMKPPTTVTIVDGRVVGTQKM